MEVHMTRMEFWSGRSICRKIATVATGIAILLATAQVLAHGGKGHASSFTALHALQKATGLYDKLVASGKLVESWETDLKKVDISNRQKGDKWEYVVSFERSAGDPSTVYIFFTAEGKYSGSNFTGD
jgi:hypothetical protein